MKKINIFRFQHNASKKIFERFDAYLRNVDIERVECKYKENGDVDRVDVFYIDKNKKVSHSSFTLEER